MSKKNHTRYDARPPFAPLIAFGLLVAAGVLIYGNTLLSPFVMDDHANITENPAIRMNRITPEKALRALQLDTAYRPLPYFSFALNYYFHEYRVQGYHAVNIAVHVFTAFMVFLVARQTFRLCGMSGLAPPLLAALLWLVNPVHTQSVTYIVQRMTSMATLFYLLSLWCYIKGRTRSAGRPVLLFAASILAGACALASKQIAASLPLFMLAYEWYFIGTLDAAWLKARVKWIIFACVVLIITGMIYLMPNPGEKILALYARQDFTPGQRLLTEPRVVMYYLTLLFFPHPALLTIDHGYPLSTGLFQPPVTLAALASLAGLLLFATKAARNHRLVSFAIFWFLGNLVIESSVIGLALIFQHRTYLPSIFPFIALSWLIFRHCPARVVSIVLMCFAIGIFGLWTHQRNTVWKSRVTFWQDTVQKAPDNDRARNNLGLALLDNGNAKGAIAEFKKAVAINPGHVAAHNNLGMAFAGLGDLGKAIDYYKKALTLGPAHPPAYVNLGAALLMADRPAEAAVVLQKAMKIAPDVAEIHDNLASAYLHINDPDKAIHHCEKALDLMPGDPVARNILGLVSLNRGDFQKAIQHFEKVLRQDPLHINTNLYMASAYLEMQAPDAALPYLETIIRLNPNNAAAHGKLGIIHAVSGKSQLAAGHLKKAIALNPADAISHFNLGNVMASQSDFNGALSHYQAALTIDPGYAKARENLGKILLHQGRTDAAMGHLDRLTAAAEDPELVYRIALLYKNNGFLDKAATGFERALAMAPDYPQCLDSLGETYVRLGHLKKAAATYRRLQQLLPNAASVAYNLACVYALQGLKTDAVAALKDAIEKGYGDLHHLLSDPDLAPLKDTAYYNELKTRLE